MASVAEATHLTSVEDRATRSGLGIRITVGGLAGLAWGAGLRGFMVEVAEAAAAGSSSVDWAGTFGWILLPGVITGVLLGLADHIRRTGGRRGWRWLALSPLVLGAVVLLQPWDLPLLLQDPIGGGAVGVALYGLIGGHALSRRGPLWGRLVSRLFLFSSVPIWALTVTDFAGPALALNTPRGLWIALYYWSFLGVLALACSIPHRRVED